MDVCKFIYTQKLKKYSKRKKKKVFQEAKKQEEYGRLPGRGDSAEGMQG